MGQEILQTGEWRRETGECTRMTGDDQSTGIDFVPIAWVQVAGVSPVSLLPSPVFPPPYRTVARRTLNTGAPPVTGTSLQPSTIARPRTAT